MRFLDEFYNTVDSNRQSIILEDDVYGTISYEDFENLSGRVYNYLLNLKLPKERIIAIRVTRSYRTYLAIIGAVKASVPFVVIGDNSPDVYIKQVYLECNPILTLDDNILNNALENDYLKGYKIRKKHDLSFIVYSTGTNGIFKGSMHEYGSIETQYMISSKIKLEHLDAFDALKNQSFLLLQGFYSVGVIVDFIDLVVYQTKLIIVDSTKVNDVDYLFALAEKKNIYTMTTSPKLLPELIKKPYSCIKEYFVSFDIFSCKYDPNYHIYNGYGSSESCGSLCYKEVDKDYDITPIGKPVYGKKVKILNKENKKTKKNEIGEIAFVPKYLRGYINQMDLYNQVYHDGYFYTGDLAYYNDANDIVLIGRKSDIKETKNGYIVPIFISNIIKKNFPNITNCYVRVFDDDSNLKIVAYYISESNYSIDEIRSKINKELDMYSMPTHVVKLEEFAYFYSGKLNKNLFLKPE